MADCRMKKLIYPQMKQMEWIVSGDRSGVMADGVSGAWFFLNFLTSHALSFYLLNARLQGWLPRARR
jgi:hypothetical protein